MTAAPADPCDALMAAFFEAVSFEPGAKPAYERLHGLFIEGGLLIKNSGAAPEIAGVAGFIAVRQPAIDAGSLTQFHEAEIAHVTERFGQVAHRFSTYTKHGVTDGQAFQARGLISTQFVHTPQGWKISAMAWDDARPGLVIPPRYEPAALRHA